MILLEIYGTSNWLTNSRYENLVRWFFLPNYQKMYPANLQSKISYQMTYYYEKFNISDD